MANAIPQAWFSMSHDLSRSLEAISWVRTWVFFCPEGDDLRWKMGRETFKDPLDGLQS